MKLEFHQFHRQAGGTSWLLIWLGVFLALGKNGLAGEPVPFAWKTSASWPGYLRGTPADLSMSQDKVFVALEDAGWISFDISNAANPTSLGFFQYGDLESVEYWPACYGIEAVSNRVYVADSEGGLAIFDITNPFSPVLSGRYREELMDAWWVRVEGSYAYVFDEGERSGLKIINIKDPRRPSLEGEFLRPGWTLQGLDAADQFIYAVGQDGALTILDAKDSQAPTLVTNLVMGASDVSIRGKRALIAEENLGLTILDVADPAHPAILGTYDLWEQDEMAMGVVAMDDRALITTWDSGLFVMDLKNPAEPQLLAKATIPGKLQKARAWGSNICLISGLDLQVWQLSETNSLVSKATLPLAGETQSIALAGTTAYLADAGGGLRILDLSDPRHPSLSATVKASMGVADVALSGSLACFVDGKRLRVLDITSPKEPRSIGYLDLTNRPSALVMTNQTVYLATGTNGLAIVDISTPTQPRIRSEFKTGGAAVQVRVSGTLAVVADQGKGIVMVDVSDPANPRSVGSYPLTSVVDLEIDRHQVYGLTFSELKILDISDPTKPLLLGNYGVLLMPESLRLSEGVAYIASGWHGVEIINVEDPARPYRVVIQDTPGYANQVRVLNHRVYVADGSMGLIVLEPDLDSVRQPVMLRPLDNVKAAPGEPVSLRAFAQGTPPLSYQWRKNGVEIPGATNEVLTIPQFAINEGGTYSVMVSNAYGLVESAPALVAPRIDRWLAEDPFSVAPVTVSLSGSGIANNEAATREEGEPLHAGKDGQKSLWSRWQPPASGIATLSTAGSSLDTLLAVYTGDELTNLVEVAHDDDRGGFLCSRVQFNAKQGTTYHIAVAGYGLTSVQGISIQGSYAFVADENLGLLIYDLSTPGHPVIVSAFSDADGALRVFVKDTTVYLADYFGLKIIDIRDLAHPQLLGNLDYEGWIEEIDATGSLVYLAAGADGLLVVDVADPRNPRIKGHFIPPAPIDTWIEDVKVLGSYAYLASWDGLFIVDISNPAAPVLVSQAQTAEDGYGFPLNVQVAGGYAFVASDYPALEVFDVQDPSRPEEVGFLDLSDESATPDSMVVRIAGDYAYITDAQGGSVFVADISVPEDPVLVTSFKTSVDTMDLALSQGYAYVAAGYSGLLTLDVRDPENPRSTGGIMGTFGSIVLSWNLEVTADQLPELTLQPELNTLAKLGEPVELKVQVNPPNSSFQWLFNGQPIPGATQPLLRRSPIIPRDAGTYRVRVTAPNGRAIESDDAEVEVVTVRSPEMEMDSAYKFTDLFLPAASARKAQLLSAGSLNQGLIGSRWASSPELELPPVSLQEYGIVAAAPRWFVFKPRMSGLYPLNTVGSEFRALLVVFTNRYDLSVVSLAIPAADQQDAFLKVPVTAGNEYFVLVASLDGTKGSIQLNWAAPTVVESSRPPWTTQMLQGCFYLSGPLLPGPYVLETAPVLMPNAGWRSITNINCLGRLDFLDSEPASANAKFYRLRLVP